MLGIDEGDALVGEMDGVYEGEVVLGVTDGGAPGDVESSDASATGARLDTGELLGVSDAFGGILVGDFEGSMLIAGVVLGASEGDGPGTLDGDMLGDI